MKKFIIGTTTVLFLAAAVYAQDKSKDKACCKKTAKGEATACNTKDQADKKDAACCKQPSKTAALRTAAKPAKPAPATTPAAKPAGK
ncbi:hypothetical protein [Chitinophaga agri]|uniref:hypothetical protein n=1 Tax=Chitinophaga agri TaxID=2703787 RepID=UPI00192EB5F6|nr:hypothetical protein [Chitinophaga agri]